MSRNSNVSPSRGLPTVSYLIGVLLVTSAAICWSIIPLGVRQFEIADTWQILFYRSLGLLPTIFALLALQTRGTPIQAMNKIGFVGVIGSLGLVAAYSGGIAAVRFTSIANAAFLFATAPFLAALIGKVLLKESIRKSTYIAMTLALLGILLMVIDSFSKGKWLGDTLALVSAVGFAIFTISLRAGKESNTLPVVMFGAYFSLVMSTGILLLYNRTLAIPVNEILLALALGGILLGTGMTIYTIGSRVIPAAELTLLCMTEVVLAPVWAWLFLNEFPDPSVIIGGSILIFAIVFNALSGIRRKPVPVTF